MQRPISKPLGTPIEELDTPALVIDLELMDRNIEAVHSFFRTRQAKIRPDVGVHGCPAIAHRQLASDGTVDGVSVRTVGQAEVFVQHGFQDVLIVNEVVSRQKIRRLCALARGARISVIVDSQNNACELSEAAEDAGVQLSGVVDVRTGRDRPGAEAGAPVVELARRISGLANLRFAGLVGLETEALDGDTRDLLSESRRRIGHLVEMRHAVEEAGLELEIVGAGGTSAYDVAGDTTGVTEVVAGSYPLMDHRHAAHRSDLLPAARVLSVVISHPEPGRALLDAGQKAIGADRGLPAIEGIDGVTVTRASAEHGWLTLEGDARERFNPKDRVWLVPPSIGDCMNLYDYVHVSRNGKLEAVWEVAGRGRYQ